MRRPGCSLLYLDPRLRSRRAGRGGSAARRELRRGPRRRGSAPAAQTDDHGHPVCRLVPIMWSVGTGADLMGIAAPMIGGVFTSFLLELLVLGAVRCGNALRRAEANSWTRIKPAWRRSGRRRAAPKRSRYEQRTRIVVFIFLPVSDRVHRMRRRPCGLRPPAVAAAWTGPFATAGWWCTTRTTPGWPCTSTAWPRTWPPGGDPVSFGWLAPRGLRDA